VEDTATTNTGRYFFDVGTNGDILQSQVTSGSWTTQDLGGEGAAQDPVGNGTGPYTSPTAVEDISGKWGTFTGPNAFYVGADGNIWQWADVGGDGWHNYSHSGQTAAA